MLGSTECVNQAIILIMFLDNILASLTLQYLFSLWIWDLTVLFLFCFCFPYYFNQVLKYINNCNLIIAICTYLSTIDNPFGISLYLNPFLCTDSNNRAYQTTWFGLQVVNILNHVAAFSHRKHCMYQTTCPHSTNQL